MHRLPLVQDCASCAAVCCVATSFAASEDFAFDKPAGVPCRHLRDSRCAIYAERAAHGCRGCELFACYGAGPRATQLFSGAAPAELIEGFSRLLAICEMIWLLTQAQSLCPKQATGLLREAAEENERLRRLYDADARTLLAVDPAQAQRVGRAILRRIGAAIGTRASLEQRACAGDGRS